MTDDMLIAVIENEMYEEISKRELTTAFDFNLATVARGTVVIVAKTNTYHGAN